MNYGELIKDAFWISWRNRFLWFFGFLLSGGQIFNLLQNANNLSRQRPPFLGDDAALYAFELRRLILDNLVLFLTLAVLLVLVGIFLSLVARGALIDSVAALYRGEERNLSAAFRAGLSNFWRMLGFSVLFFVISIVLLVPIFLITLFSIFGLVARIDSSSAGIATVVFAVLLLFVVVLLIFVPLGIVFMLGLQALVLNREGIFGSFGSGYGLLVRRPGRVLLVALVSFGLGLAASIMLLILALILGLLLAAPALILFAVDLGTAGTVAGIVAALILLPILLVASGALGAFNHSYWTLAYLRLVALPEEAPAQEA